MRYVRKRKNYKLVFITLVFLLVAVFAVLYLQFRGKPANFNKEPTETLLNNTATVTPKIVSEFDKNHLVNSVSNMLIGYTQSVIDMGNNRDNHCYYLDTEEEHSVTIFFDTNNDKAKTVSVSISKENYDIEKNYIETVLKTLNESFGISDTALIMGRIDEIRLTKTSDFPLGNEYILYDNVNSSVQVVLYDLSHNLQVDYNVLETSDGLPPQDVMLINSENPVPEDFKPDLVEFKGYQVASVLADDLEKMYKAAELDGVNLEMTSAYRSFDEQSDIYNSRYNGYLEDGYSADEALEMVEEFVAKPGHSEHQTGLAIDFAGEAMWRWLLSNAHEYGFIYRYPDDKVLITGIGYEPWHYYYVGVDLASYIYSKDLVLEEYLSITANA